MDHEDDDKVTLMSQVHQTEPASQINPIPGGVQSGVIEEKTWAVG